MVWVQTALRPQLRGLSWSRVAQLLPGGPQRSAVRSLTAQSCKHGHRPEQEQQEGYSTEEKSKDVSQANKMEVSLAKSDLRNHRTHMRTSLSLWPISPLLLVRFTLCKQEALAPFLGGTLFICLSPGSLSSSSSLSNCISKN